MIPLPDACHGPRFLFLPPFPPQSESSPGLNRSLLRHPMRTYQISLASWQPARWSGYLDSQFLKTAFQKALFFFLKDGKRGRIQCLMLASNLQSFSEEFYRVIIISWSRPMWNRSQCIITRVTHKESMSSVSFRMGQIYILTNYQSLVQYLSLSLSNVSKFEQIVPNFKVTEHEQESRT